MNCDESYIVKATTTVHPKKYAAGLYFAVFCCD